MNIKYIISLSMLVALMGAACLNAKVHPDDQLLNAAKNGDMSQLNRAIKRDANINATDEQGLTALMMAVHAGDEDMTAKLLKLDEINIDAADQLGRTALMLAIDYNRKKIAAMLLEHGARATRFSRSQKAQLSEWGLHEPVNMRCSNRYE